MTDPALPPFPAPALPGLPGLKRVLIANRGEIAVRVARACRALGLEAVAAVSEADAGSLAARLAGRQVVIGPPPPAQSYLAIERLVDAALRSGCDAVHPGYGFLSERAAFAQACLDAGLVFVGPTPAAIAAMGDKITAAKLAADSAGGGGRGMRVVREASQMDSAFAGAQAEAQAAFGDGTLYVEKLIERARHVEIQLMADRHGHVVHLGERECSTQRRHQKLIEESPSPAVDAAQRAAMGEAAVALARRVGYQGAGTVEFVLDDRDGRFYFLEMNTRIQVEHPVTEMVTGIDLVAEQLRVAAGLPLSFTQAQVATRGHAIECRINAEDPERNFLPRPGVVARWAPPQGEGIRCDSHCHDGYTVTPYYDSLLGKLIVHAPTRALAIERMRDALQRLQVEGPATTAPFHGAVLAHEDFRAGRVTTRWVEELFLPQRKAAARPNPHGSKETT
ncbi:MAG: ATP-grasp domain-containing protein [Burkholderiaceae bacterium]|nr:ATP-grasp domain-containing protein [Burkholderiaceae bacterium]